MSLYIKSDARFSLIFFLFGACLGWGLQSLVPRPWSLPSTQRLHGNYLVLSESSRSPWCTMRCNAGSSCTGICIELRTIRRIVSSCRQVCTYCKCMHRVCSPVCLFVSSCYMMTTWRQTPISYSLYFSRDNLFLYKMNELSLAFSSCEFSLFSKIFPRFFSLVSRQGPSWWKLHGLSYRQWPFVRCTFGWH